MAGIGEGRRRLEEEGRLADAGIAADEEGRAAHEPAAGDAVELGDAGPDPRCLGAFAGERRQGDDAALPHGFRRRAGPDAAARGRFLDEGVPLAAIVAAALPARTDGAAVLADILGFRLGHGAPYTTGEAA